MTSLWATSSGVPTGFGGKLDDSRPVTSWKSQEVTLCGSKASTSLSAWKTVTLSPRPDRMPSYGLLLEKYNVTRIDAKIECLL